MNASDIELIRSIQKGDVRAFELLVKRYQNSLFNFVFKMLRDYSAAEELVQEVFLKVYQALPRFKVLSDAKLSTWIFKIAYNLSLNEIKRRRRLYEFKRKSLEHEYERTMQKSLESIKTEELGDEFLFALKKLPEKQQAAILLRVTEDLSYREISGVLNVSVSSIEALIFRARKNLKKYLYSDSKG